MRKRRMLFLFPRKGRTGLGLPQGRCLRLDGKSPHFRPWAPGCIFLPNLVSAIAPLPLSCSKKESAYSDRWTHKKNVTMYKQNVNTTPSMKGKGDSSSSHYRINSGADGLNSSAMHIERVSDESDSITNETINGISLKLSQGLHLEISRSRGLEKLINREIERSSEAMKHPLLILARCVFVRQTPFLPTKTLAPRGERITPKS